MNPVTGEIHHLPKELIDELQQKTPEGSLLIPLTAEQVEELRPLDRGQRKNNMRNKPCICGSGVKFKRCCWHRFEISRPSDAVLTDAMENKAKILAELQEKL